ncbi:MAG: protein-disulfide reductase, partial [Candidatus Cloacimonetes bacterium]|nr:protein-disulfide reductase [Candidatus Cloacimonadota bacterium]
MFKKLFLIGIILLIISSVFAQTEIVEPKIEAVIKENQIEVTYSIPEGYHQSLQEDYFYIETEEIKGVTFEPTVYPEGKKDAEGNIEYYGTVTLIKKFTIEDNFKDKIEQIKIYAGYQLCLDSGACLFPEEKEFSLPLKSEPVSPETSGTSPLNILKYLLMAFIGGLILNIMPCVLPVLSIKAMSIVKQSQQDKKMIFKSSMAYTLGILASFIILAIIIVILKMSGEMVGWGFQFQSTGFVLALLIVIFVFALSLFDVFIIQVPGMTAATKASSKGGLTGSFLSGIFAVLLATPCTAPLLGAALGFAFFQPPVMIFSIFILIGLG